MHEKRMSRTDLLNVIKTIYVPKYKVKRFSPYLYADGKRGMLTKRTVKNFQTQDHDSGLILGIETSFDDTCSAVVSGRGEVLSNEKISFGKFYAEHAPLKSA